MTRKKEILCLLVLMLVNVACRTASPRPAAPMALTSGNCSGLGCNSVVVYPTSKKGGQIVLNYGGVSCSKGAYFGVSPNNQSVQSVTVNNGGGLSSVNCDVTLVVNTKSYTVNVQQSYCDLEGGTLTASVTAGDAKVTRITQPTFSGNCPGTVSVDLK
jgi:hypothetical protein